MSPRGAVNINNFLSNKTQFMRQQNEAASFLDKFNTEGHIRTRKHGRIHYPCKALLFPSPSESAGKYRLDGDVGDFMKM